MTWFDPPELEHLVTCLLACHHTLKAAADADGRANVDLARGCSILAKIQADRLQRLIDADTQKRPAPG